jgi:hypothetical protein
VRLVVEFWLPGWLQFLGQHVQLAAGPLNWVKLVKFLMRMPQLSALVNNFVCMVVRWLFG